MEKSRKIPAVIMYGVAGMLLFALAPLPYGYYTLLRIVVTIFFAWSAVVSHDRHHQVLPWIFGLLALLFNPIVPVYLSRDIWAPIDVGAAALIIFSRNILSTWPRPLTD